MTFHSDLERRMMVAPRPGPSERVELRLQDDGSLWCQVTKPYHPADTELQGVDEYTRVFNRGASPDNYDLAVLWARNLLSL